MHPTQIKKFYSYCGGLPAPECAHNPLGFKFSWSPRGALLSQCNSASFISEGKQVDISSQDLMAIAKPYHVLDGYDFVAYPNRDSVPFREFYNIPEADTVVRGSLRYKGNPEFVHSLAKLGWLDTEEKPWLKPGMTWAQIMQKAIGIDTGEPEERFAVSLALDGFYLTLCLLSALIPRIKEICKFSNEADSDRIISGLRWIGLFSSTQADVRGGNLLDTLAGQLEKLMSYQPGERDLVMLQHKFVIEWSDGKTVCLTISGHLAFNLT